MNTLILLLSFACALASPAPYVVSRSPAIQFSRSNTEILGQINQLNDDGTYTFGYESADGSFRVENRDIDGFVSGKYGYVDANGQIQEFEYVAGSTNGQAIGYQARGTAIPETTRAQGFPVLSSAVSVDQKFQDYEYSSVDDDRDGFPDNLFDGSFGTRNVVQPNIVRLTGSQAQSTYESTSPILRAVVNPSKVSVQPSVVRLTSSSQTPSSVVRVVNPARTPQKSVVRLTTPSNTVRFVNPAQVSNQQQQIVRLNTPKTVIQPARLAGGGYQVVRQRQQQPQQFVQFGAGGQSLLRSPSYYTSSSNYGGQRFVSRSPVRSSGRLNPFFGGVAATASNVRDNFGSLVIRDNNKLTNSFAPSSVQTVFIDSDDFDDLNDFDDDFDDDDSFIVGSSAFLG